MSWERKVRGRLERYTVKETEEEVPGYLAFPQTKRERSHTQTHTITQEGKEWKVGRTKKGMENGCP